MPFADADAAAVRGFLAAITEGAPARVAFDAALTMWRERSTKACVEAWRAEVGSPLKPTI